MCRWTASSGTRSNAPIIGGPNGCSPRLADFIKELDELTRLIYGQVTLPLISSRRSDGDSDNDARRDQARADGDSVSARGSGVRRFGRDVRVRRAGRREGAG